MPEVGSNGNSNQMSIRRQMEKRLLFRLAQASLSLKTFTNNTRADKQIQLFRNSSKIIFFFFGISSRSKTQKSRSPKEEKINKKWNKGQAAFLYALGCPALPTPQRHLWRGHILKTLSPASHSAHEETKPPKPPGPLRSMRGYTVSVRQNQHENPGRPGISGRHLLPFHQDYTDVLVFPK